MKRCVIHFGMAKTGSSSIQQTMFRIGRREEFAYLQAGENNATKAVPIAFMSNPSGFRPLKRLGQDGLALQLDREGVLGEFEKILDSDAENFLLSTEMLSGLDESTLLALRQWLADRVDVIDLIGYIRPIRPYLDSMFSQSFKNGNDKFNVAKRYPDFRKRLLKLEAVFGRENVRYRAFDIASLRNGCVVQDLAEFLGVKVLAEEVRRVNDGLSREATGLLYAFRKYGPGYAPSPQTVRENIRMIKRLGALRGTKLRLSARLVDPVLRANAEDLAWMEGRLGRSLSSSMPAADAASDEVDSESDLLRFSADTLSWLADQTQASPELRSLIMAGEGRDVANAVDLLRRLAPARNERRKRNA